MVAAEKRGKTMMKVKLIIFLVLTVIAVIIVFQNTESVQTKLLFATIVMPRALLLFVTTIIGFAAGVLVALSLSKKRKAGQ